MITFGLKKRCKITTFSCKSVIFTRFFLSTAENKAKNYRKKNGCGFTIAITTVPKGGAAYPHGRWT
jgi:hypothetical protein